MTADRSKITIRIFNAIHLFDPQVRLNAYDLVLQFTVKAAHYRKHDDQSHHSNGHAAH